MKLHDEILNTIEELDIQAGIAALSYYRLTDIPMPDAVRRVDTTKRYLIALIDFAMEVNKLTNNNDPEPSVLK